MHSVVRYRYSRGNSKIAKIVWHCRDPETRPRSLEVVSTGKAEPVALWHSSHWFLIFIPDAQLASWPNMDHYRDSYCFHADQKVQDQTHSKNQLSNHQYVWVGVTIHIVSMQIKKYRIKHTVKINCQIINLSELVLWYMCSKMWSVDIQQGPLHQSLEVVSRVILFCGTVQHLALVTSIANRKNKQKTWREDMEQMKLKGPSR